jgi:hypothetical protein
VSLFKTSCYQLSSGGARCRGSFGGERTTTCSLSGGCDQDYLGPVVSIAAYLHEHMALAGEVAMYHAVELSPTDDHSSLLVGPRFKLGRAFGQVLIGRRWHSVFPDGLAIQPGGGIDIGGVMGTRLQVDYAWFGAVPELSGLRVHVAFVAHLGWRARHASNLKAGFTPGRLVGMTRSASGHPVELTRNP